MPHNYRSLQSVLQSLSKFSVSFVHFILIRLNLILLLSNELVIFTIYLLLLFLHDHTVAKFCHLCSEHRLLLPVFLYSISHPIQPSHAHKCSPDINFYCSLQFFVSDLQVGFLSHTSCTLQPHFHVLHNRVVVPFYFVKLKLLLQCTQFSPSYTHYIQLTSRGRQGESL